VLASTLILNREFKKLELKHSIDSLCNRVLDDLKSKKNYKSEFSSINLLIHELIDYALSLNVSDIHIESMESSVSARYRIDGVLHTIFTLAKEIFSPLVLSIKIMGNISFTDTNLAGDGRFTYNKIDFRVSTMPTIYGESIVIRILNQTDTIIELKELGFAEDIYKKYKKLIHKNSGLILTVGPTGCGKTTTLYSTLKQIESDNKKIISVEDPIEYQFDSIQQISINEKQGRTFAKVLKNILRQDPDVLMIGEIRDKDSLNIAIESSLTGHLVFSTLHTNDAISTVIRLEEMGITKYLLAQVLLAIHSGRLIRRLCRLCKQKIKNSSEIYKSIGCSQCGFTGFSGRFLISEMLIVDENISKAIISGASKYDILKIAKKSGFIDIKSVATKEVLLGNTTQEELNRVLG
jgi:general secretion pathway protein E